MDKFNKEELKRIAGSRARENHANGLNCGESTFKAIVDTLVEAGMTDFPPEIVALSTGMGGGIGSSGNTCGALTGACMGIGIIHGRKDPMAEPSYELRRAQLDGEAGLYRFFNNVVFDFKQKNNNTCCFELIKEYDYKSDERKLYCRNIIGSGAEMAIEWIFSGIEKGYRHPYHFNIMGIKE